MAEEKFASLTSGLLARKGAATPAMRREGYMNPQGDIADDLGWNDMGYDPPYPVEADEERHDEVGEPEVRRRLDQLSRDYEAEDEHEIPHGGRAGLTAMAGPGDLVPDKDDYDESADYVEENDYEPEAEFETAGLNGAANDYVTAQVVHDVPELSEQAIANVVPIARPDSRPMLRRETSAEPEIRARDKVAFTLRLDKHRHLKLRLASAIENRSAQQLVTEAIDAYFRAVPDLETLAANVAERK